MKKLSFQLLLVLILILSVSSLGCKKEKEAVLDEATKTEIINTITKLTNEAFEAGSNHDLDKLFSHVSDHAITLENGAIDYSWEEHKKKAREVMANVKEYKTNIDEMKVDVLSPNVAIVYGKYTFAIADKSDNTFQGTQAWTWVFNKEKEHWKIRHIHVSAPPKTN